MKTKEAIEFMNKHIEHFKDDTDDIGVFDHEGVKKLITDAEQVIALLQQGERDKKELRKYCSILERLNDYKEATLLFFEPDGTLVDKNITLEDVIKKLEQKYFPNGLPQ